MNAPGLEKSLAELDDFSWETGGRDAMFFFRWTRAATRFGAGLQV